MHIEPKESVRPDSRFQSGVVISARRERQGDDVQFVQVAQDGMAFEALAVSSPWLSQALDGPLAARTLHLVRCDNNAGSPPFLLGASLDPFTDGFSHLPETACPVDGVVLGVKTLVASTQAVPLKIFLMSVFQRRDVFRTFWTMPASAKHHHARPGGLAVHSLEVAHDIAAHGSLSDLELDLGIAGGLLHDIGKLWSYTNDMFPNAANLAMGHELVGLSRLEPELAALEKNWPDGAYVMRCLLSGHTRMRDNGSIPTSLLPRIKACDQRSCEQDRVRSRARNSSCPVWTPQPW
jgi:hypothetical protein